MKAGFAIAAAAAVLLVAVPAAADGADGKGLFEKKCAMCHGKDGVATKMAVGSKNFNDKAWKATANADAIVKGINEGKGKMKPVKVTPEEAKAIATYILSLPAAP